MHSIEHTLSSSRLNGGGVPEQQPPPALEHNLSTSRVNGGLPGQQHGLPRKPSGSSFIEGIEGGGTSNANGSIDYASSASAAVAASPFRPTSAKSISTSVIGKDVMQGNFDFQ